MKKIIVLSGIFLLFYAAVGFAAPSFSFDGERYVLENELADAALLDAVPLEIANSEDRAGASYYMLRTYVPEGKTFDNTHKWFDIQSGTKFNDQFLNSLASTLVKKIEAAGLVGGGGLYCGGGQVIMWEEPGTREDPDPKFIIQRLVASSSGGHGKIIRFVYQDEAARFKKVKETLVEDPYSNKQINVFRRWAFDICNLF
ncbi:MAG: hypothetical protein IKP06_06645 [Elusimicrobiaceae bacterium]|nr:hypothetical protein [Elusimicrobiaceae bacterium]